MSSTSDPSESHRESSDQSALEAGLKALQRQDYQAAIARLEPIAESASAKSDRLRARMGLVIAYQNTAQVKRAIALCQKLTRSSSEKVQTWATKTLQTLTERYPQNALPKPPKPPAPSQEPTATGFVPFDPPSPSPPVADTGFVPFEPSQQPPRVLPSVPPKPNSVPSVSIPSKTLNKTPQNPSETVKHSPLSSKPQKQQGQSPSVSQSLHPQTPETPISLTLETQEPANFIPPLNQQESLRLEIEPFQWKKAGRANQWRRLRPPKLEGFYLELIVTVSAFLWLTPRGLEWLMETLNDILAWLPIVKPIQLFYRDPTQGFYFTVGILFILSPWLLDYLLKWCWGMKPLPLTTLFQRSQEANRVLRTSCQNRNWKVPSLRILPLQTPVAFSYGHFPRFARIVVSQGLLDQLEEDEIALIYGREIASMSHWDTQVMTFVTVITLIPYLIYWQTAEWADRSSELLNLQFPSWIPDFVKPIFKVLIPVLKPLAEIISPLSYGLYWVLRWPALWVSRRRVYYSDRIASNITGNPNGLTRALLKIAMGIARDIQQQQKTHPLLEGFDLLTPVGYQQAISLGSLLSHRNLESLLVWDFSNPDRSWFTLNQSHPLWGERLLLLSAYADFWKLEPEFNLDVKSVSSSRKRLKFTSKLFLQGAPYFGIPAGFAMGGLLWLIGGLLSAIGLWQFEWLFGDYWIMAGCLPIACSLGIFIRQNSFFPEIKGFNLPSNPDWSEFLLDPTALPIDHHPIRLEGKLLGRTGIRNSMGQDLILETPIGLIRLHYVPSLTPLANLLPRFTRPEAWVNQRVIVTGWWRRGATPWVDVDTLQKSDHPQTLVGGHPIWSTLIAILLAIWGASMISQGGF